MIDNLISICQQAGDAILNIYNDSEKFDVVDYKADDSPLTLADHASHLVIQKQLETLYPDIPVLSEEGKLLPFETRSSWKKFWCVDPLDGTKEFIKRNGEFTVNIALIEDDFPILGIIYAPVTNTFYYGGRNLRKSFKQIGNAKPAQITVNNAQPADDKVAVRSRSHASPEEESVLSTYQVTKSISVGSSLKFCMVAEGKADVYYRHGPTMEWDTAAGQAVVEGAGGTVRRLDDKQRFYYNKKELLNPGFLCLGF